MTTVVAAVIQRDGRILAGQRKPGGNHPLKWEFPGGKVEADETPEAALSRELTEELGIRARIQSEITRYEYQYAGRPRILLIFYRVVDFEGEPQNLDFEQLQWVLPEKLRNLDFLEGDVDFVRRYFSAQAT
ncbi:MAG TPA: (deoxy)nucleoside triphosphate pyrophosphohydrolase [Bryobacteraceae bacterium]|jgi:8-oxo-dGTP diphosphatase|nr:(deoxy)nucleoside triphosphate pyrophosphohydrolase [Bryobacteraceae bacterium]